MTRVVGKPAPGNWPVEEYTQNEGSVGRKRIVFVGASYKFVHKVLRDMLLVGGFDETHLVVHDLDETPLNIVADLLERIVRQTGSKITVSRTLNRAQALKDADAVILSITVGGEESDCRSFEVCAKYGIPVGVGDTLGPAALARNLRTLPVVVEIARDMKRLCPNAVLLNFTNPMSCVTGVIGRETGITCWGLCHSADEQISYFARVFGVKKSEIRIEQAGVNHQSFLTRLWVQGAERTKDILTATQASSAKMEDTLLETREEETALQQDIFRLLGVWPSCGGTHLAEFYEYFFTPRRVEQLRLTGHLKRLRPGREPFGRRTCPQIIRDWAYGPELVGDLHLLTSEHAHELLWACFTGQPYTRGLNVLNTGEFIRGLPKDACVEAMVTVAGKNVTGDQVTLPPAAHSLVQRWVTIHDLSIRAAMHCDRDAARQALFLDPHVADLYDIAPMLEDFLTALAPWLPKGWFA